VAATVSCRDDVSSVVPCSGTAVRSASLQATAPLVPGESYQVLVDPAGGTPLTDRAGNAAAASVKAFRAALLQQENSKATRMSWRTVRSSLAKGGSYLVEHRVGASASYTFTGTSVVWLTATGRAYGVASVYVDNVRKLVVNNYGPVTRFGVGRAVTGLTAGTHKLTIVVAGKKGSTAGTDTQVVVDAFRVGTVVTVTPVVSTAWRRVVTTAALGGGYSAADLSGQATSLTFRGTGITWYSLRSRGSGLARVYVDGVLKMTVDNYGATAYRLGRTITGLTNARHTISVVLLGTHRKGALGSTVAIDAWLVR